MTTNLAWIVLCGFLVMLMQAGFAMVETGLCRAKNAAHTMWMNLMVYALGMTGFFISGYALMTGGDPAGRPDLVGSTAAPDLISIGPWGIFGKSAFLLAGLAPESAAIAWFVFLMAVMNVAVSIPTGALAERWRAKSFFLFSLVTGAVIYPIFGCWVWGGGWLAQLGVRLGLGHGAADFAGSGVVHLQGGVMAFALCRLIGPRIGKYGKDRHPRPILGHHIPMVILGTFALAFAWLGFNAGPALAANGTPLGIVAVNTMLAPAAGAIASALYMWFRFGRPDPSVVCNGTLAGLVAISAPCAFVGPWAAFLIGAFAGVLAVWSVFLWERRGIDDPVGAISVHGISGAWGILALGLFANGAYGAGWNGVGAETYLGHPGQGVTGLLYGDGRQFLAQLLMVITCIAWNVLLGTALFLLVGGIVGGNRVAVDEELAGLDIPEVGAVGYPDFIEAMGPEQISKSEIVAGAAELANHPHAHA